MVTEDEANDGIADLAFRYQAGLAELQRKLRVATEALAAIRERYSCDFEELPLRCPAQAECANCLASAALAEIEKGEKAKNVTIKSVGVCPQCCSHCESGLALVGAGGFLCCPVCRQILLSFPTPMGEKADG